MNKETLSTSQESPKHKFALEEKYKEETGKLPKPTGWRILVLPFKMKSRAVPIDPDRYATFELQKTLGRLEEKKGGLVRKGRPKLTKKGWK